jgi:hypothetical protein
LCDIRQVFYPTIEKTLAKTRENDELVENHFFQSGGDMALQLRQAVVHKVISTTLLLAVASVVLNWFTKILALNAFNLTLLMLLSLVMGLIAGWRTMQAMAQATINGIPEAMAMARVSRDHVFGEVSIDWHQLDDYAAQLEAAGYQHVGDFTTATASGGNAFTGVAVIYIDQSGTTLVEIQFIQLHKKLDAASGGKAGGVHFSVFSLVGGRINVCTTDHTPIGVNYIFRTVSDVMAAYPGETLMFLLDKHRQLVKTVCQRTGKQVTGGLSMARYMLLHRERHARIRAKLRKMGALRMMTALDRFEANPVLNWSAPATTLAALPLQTLEALDNDPVLNRTPLIVDLSANDKATEPAAKEGSALAIINHMLAEPDENAEQDPEEFRRLLIAFLQRRAHRVSTWFYWIAGASVINFAVALSGSKWHISMGLGVTQLLQEQYRGLPGMAAALACVLLCVGCGFLARKARVAVFAIGITLYALDTFIFVMAGDTMGIIIHFLLLFLLYRGLRASRALLRLQAEGAQVV